AVTVTDLPPAVTAPADQNAVEGTGQGFALGSFTDPGPQGGPWSVDVNWGDGTAHDTFSAAAVGTLGSLSHAYAASGLFAVTVTVTGAGGLAGAATFHVTAANAAPVVTAPADQSATAGAAQAFSLGSFSDLGAQDNPWAVDVNWGDGTAHDSFSKSAPGSL